MKKTIKVTKTDIRLGAKSITDGRNCIIARAAKRAGLRNVNCYFNELVFGSKLCKTSIRLPKSAINVQSKIMDLPYLDPEAYKKVLAKKVRTTKPFSFVIEY